MTGMLLIIMSLLALALSWIVTCGIIKLITLCFGVAFSWLIATGVWLVLLLLRSVFKKQVDMIKFKMYGSCLLNAIKIDEENKQMAKLTGYYAVAVIEEGTGCCKKDYYYAVFDDGITYKAGDQVLVSGCNKDVLTIKEILTVPEAEVKCNKNITAEIICRVDTSAYDQRVENRKKAEKLKKDMDAVIKQMDVTKKYEMYAADNPVLAALLDQYKELTK